MLQLAQLACIEKRADVCLLGPPSTGKTYLAIALGLRAASVATASSSPPPKSVSRLEQAQD